MALLIAIEGTDGSGKATQIKGLFSRLKIYKHPSIIISFPDYDSKSSELVKMYLNGDFGKNIEDINPYMSSIFYAADRVTNFQKKWKNIYNDTDMLILADRYVWSNLAYQNAKFISKDEKEKFTDWILDLEFCKLGLPKPDLTIFLDMKPELSKQLREERGRKDIHENNDDYLQEVYKEYKDLAKKFEWKTIKCYRGNELRNQINIGKDIFKIVEETIKTTTKISL
jgi:dTMP kinase